MGIIFITIFIIYVIVQSYKLYKESKANKRLNELYQKRFAEAERIERMIKEKPDEIILSSEIYELGIELHYIGRLDELGKRVPCYGDIASKDGRIYLYKNNKWYEVIDDINYYIKLHNY